MSHCFSVQLLVDFDHSTEWVNKKLVALVSTDDGVEDGSIHVTVNIFCYQLKQTYPSIAKLTHSDHFSCWYIHYIHTFVWVTAVGQKSSGLTSAVAQELIDEQNNEITAHLKQTTKSKEKKFLYILQNDSFLFDTMTWQLGTLILDVHPE